MATRSCKFITFYEPFATLETLNKYIMLSLKNIFAGTKTSFTGAPYEIEITQLSLIILKFIFYKFQNVFPLRFL